MQVDFERFRSARVLVVGDVMLDRYWYGKTTRVSPEAPVPVVRVEQTEERPGGAGNVALNGRALGANVTLLGVTGSDEAAKKLFEQLKGQGVRCCFFPSPGTPTVTKLRVLSQHQQLIRLDFEKDGLAFDPAPLLESYRAQLDRCDVVLLSDYGKGSVACSSDLIRMARERNIPVIVDPKGVDFSRYAGATVVTPNLKEFQAVVGPCADAVGIESEGRELCRKLELDALLITRGEEGMTLIQVDGEVVHLPALAAEVYDVTGAGDTVLASFGLALSVGETMVRAAKIANIAAGQVVAKLGATTVGVAELRSALDGPQGQSPGIMDEGALISQVQRARQNGQRVVMTNGCFDILHAGHVRYLQAARELGDRLVVAVNDDDSVRRLKGPARPVNALEQRLTVLDALSCVDWIVPFTEDTPERLIGNVTPDVLVKGGDYKPAEIAGAKQVEAAGGEVVVLEYIEGLSTSGLMETLHQSSENLRTKP